MRTIAEAREDVAKCWGIQKLKETDYRPILYLVRTECEEGTLVLNTVTGQMVLLTAEELTALDTLPGPLPESLLPLMEAHFVVPVDFDEKKSVNQLRALLLRLNRKKEITSYTILPTTACNARCFYCYEANYAHHTMTEETANQVVEFIAAHCGPDKKVAIRWFGGEPMVGMARIDQICEGLQEKGIEYNSRMVSNGYLYSKELVQHAKDAWNLKHIQITLDGTEDVYNSVKAYVNTSDNPYLKVMVNIGYLLDADVKVHVRMNLGPYNVEILKNLIHELSVRFHGWPNFSAYCHLLFDNKGFEPISYNNLDLDKLESNFDEIISLLQSKSLSKPLNSLPSIQLNQCIADSDECVVINPLGEIGKCEHYAYEHLAGNVMEGIKNTSVTKGWKEKREWLNCSTCCLYPTCINLTHCESIYECANIQIGRKKIKIQNCMLSVFNAQLAPKDEDEMIENCF